MKLKWQWLVLAMVGIIVIILVFVGRSLFFKLSDRPDLAAMLQSSQIQSIEITQNWTGLSETAPLESYYSLHPDTTGYTGQGKFTVGGYSGSPIHDVQTLQVPQKNIEAFLSKLAETQFVEGKYEPKIEWTDDYPDLAIEIKLRDDSILFYSSSQGGNHVPWAISYHGKTYVVNSGTPMHAINRLSDYLKSDRLDQLEYQLMSELYPASFPPYTATPPP